MEISPNRRLLSLPPDLLSQVFNRCNGCDIGLVYLCGDSSLNHLMTYRGVVKSFVHHFTSPQRMHWPPLVSKLAGLEILLVTVDNHLDQTPVRGLDRSKIPSSVRSLELNFLNGVSVFVGPSSGSNGTRSLQDLSTRWPHLQSLVLHPLTAWNAKVSAATFFPPSMTSLRLGIPISWNYIHTLPRFLITLQLNIKSKTISPNKDPCFPPELTRLTVSGASISQLFRFLPTTLLHLSCSCEGELQPLDDLALLPAQLLSLDLAKCALAKASPAQFALLPRNLTLLELKTTMADEKFVEYVRALPRDLRTVRFASGRPSPDILREERSAIVESIPPMLQEAGLLDLVFQTIRYFPPQITSLSLISMTPHLSGLLPKTLKMLTVAELLDTASNDTTTPQQGELESSSDAPNPTWALPTSITSLNLSLPKNPASLLDSISRLDLLTHMTARRDHATMQLISRLPHRLLTSLSVGLSDFAFQHPAASSVSLHTFSKLEVLNLTDLAPLVDDPFALHQHPFFCNLPSSLTHLTISTQFHPTRHHLPPQILQSFRALHNLSRLVVLTVNGDLGDEHLTLLPPNLLHLRIGSDPTTTTTSITRLTWACFKTLPKRLVYLVLPFISSDLDQKAQREALEGLKYLTFMAFSQGPFTWTPKSFDTLRTEKEKLESEEGLRP